MENRAKKGNIFKKYFLAFFVYLFLWHIRDNQAAFCDF
jgi:hypothetical protein